MKFNGEDMNTFFIFAQDGRYRSTAAREIRRPAVAAQTGGETSAGVCCG
jgi:hypothetical protein